MTFPIGTAGDFATQMRVGTLEMTLALALVALLAARPRVRAAADVGALMPMEVDVEIFERGSRRTLALRAPFELGRSREAEIFLRDPEVSRRQARFEGENGVVYVEDLRSSNGTFLNGRRINEAIEIREGDEIDVGTTRLVVTSVRPA